MIGAFNLAMINKNEHLISASETGNLLGNLTSVRRIWRAAKQDERDLVMMSLTRALAVQDIDDEEVGSAGNLSSAGPYRVWLIDSNWAHSCSSDCQE